MQYCASRSHLIMILCKNSCTKKNLPLQIPVFKGAGSPLVGANKLVSDHFGTDGLGDVIVDRDPLWEDKIQKEHAVNAMIRLVNENPKQVRNLCVCGTSVAL